MTYRNKKLLRTAKGQMCVLCGSMETTVSAHCNDIEWHGMSLKAPDCLIAWLCQDCHDVVDGRGICLTKEERRALWDRAFKRTVVQWFEQGVVDLV